MSSSSSPHRSRGGGANSNSSGSNVEDRPRFFDSNTKRKCWAKAETLIGRHPERWRKDGAGNIVCKRFCNCQGCLCFEYDHIVPFSKGGESTYDNCQILQTRVNRFKSDKDSVDPTQLRGYSCDIKFTGYVGRGLVNLFLPCGRYLAAEFELHGLPFPLEFFISTS